MNKCSGDFARCMMGCGMGEMGCSDRCLKDHPPNPSRCERDANVACR